MMELEPERQVLDFDRDVRSVQLSKLTAERKQISEIGSQQWRQNQQSLAHVDSSHKHAAELESNLIVSKMDNMNLATTSEVEGIKFLGHCGERSRDSQSLNSQINQI